MLKTILSLFAISFVFLYFIYSPALNLDFVHHDQYRFFQEYHGRAPDIDTFKNDCHNDREYGWIRTLGRFVSAEIECSINKYTRTSSDLGLIRYIAIGLSALSATLIAILLIQIRKGKIFALLTGLTFFTLPGIVNFIHMNNLPNLLVIFLALLSALMILGIDRSTSSGRWFPHLWQWFLYIFALMVFLVAIFSYPTLAMILFLPLLLHILFDNRDGISRVKMIQYIRLFGVHLMVFGLSAVIYWVTVKYFIQAGLKIPANYQVGFTDDLMGKSAWFYYGVMRKTANLQNIYYFINDLSTLVSGIIGLSLFVAPLINIFKYKKNWKDEGTVLVVQLIAIVVIGGIISAPILLMSSTFLMSRVILPVGMVVLAVFLFAIWRLSQVLPMVKTEAALLVAALYFTIAAFSAGRISAQSALNDFMELHHIATTVASKIDEGIDRIHVIMPIKDNIPARLAYNGFPFIGDEFNNNSLSHLHFVPEIVRTAVLQLLPDEKSFVVTGCPNSKVLECLAGKKYKNEIFVTFSFVGEEFIKTNGTVVVDMNPLLRAGARELNYNGVPVY